MNWDQGCSNENFIPDGPEFFPSLHVSDGPGFKNQAIEILNDPGRDLISFGAFAVPSRFRVYIPQGSKYLSLNFFGEGNGALCGAACRFQKPPQFNYCNVKPSTWQGLPWQSKFTLAKAEVADFQSNVQGGGFSFVQYFREPGLDAGGWLYIKTFDVDDDQGFYQVQYVLQVWRTQFITWLNSPQTQWDSNNDPLPLTGEIIVEPVKPVKVTLTGPATVEIGKPAVYTAKGTGGTGQYEYRFWLLEKTPWVSVQDYSPMNTLTWTPVKPGKFQVGVWIRTLGGQTPTDQHEGAIGIPVAVKEVAINKISVSVNGQTFITSFPLTIEVK